MTPAGHNQGEPSMKKLLEGKVLGERYKLIEWKAEGNFGAVFLSEQLFLGSKARRVAVKVSKRKDIPADKAREIFSDVFTLAQAMDEMKNATARSRLVHVYDAGLTEENRAFVVMEYVDGPTLQTELRRAGRADVTQLLRWTRQIAEAIAGLHRLPRPLVHRDLKPDNILLGFDHAVRVVDFGLTARLNDRGWIPGVAGTTTYMAPETTKGRSVPASDIYSVGLIMYQALTGGLPFDELVPPVEMQAEKHSEWLTDQKGRIVILPPSRRNPAVPEKLDRLVLKCLQFAEGARIASGDELLNALDEVEKKEPRPDEAALAEGRRLKQAGDAGGAATAWDRGLRVPQPDPATQAELLDELARLAEETGKKQSALERRIQLWEKVQGSGIVMRSSKDRAELLDRIITLALELNNVLQAEKYRAERRRRFPNFR